MYSCCRCCLWRGWLLLVCYSLCCYYGEMRKKYSLNSRLNLSWSKVCVSAWEYGRPRYDMTIYHNCIYLLFLLCQLLWKFADFLSRTKLTTPAIQNNVLGFQAYYLWVIVDSSSRGYNRKIVISINKQNWKTELSVNFQFIIGLEHTFQ